MTYINTAPYSCTFISGLSLKDRMECSKRGAFFSAAFDVHLVLIYMLE